MPQAHWRPNGAGDIVKIAITREVSPAMNACELTHLEREPIDIQEAGRQHRDYEALLAELGCEVKSLPAEPELPDSFFVEDTAVVLDEVAVICRPGAASRLAEVPSVEAAISEHRRLLRIEPPGTLDGGDVLRMCKTIYVGRSARSDGSGIAQFTALLAPYGYRVVPVEMKGCLHLKTAVAEVADGAILINPSWLEGSAFPGAEILAVDPGEPMAANALRVGNSLVYPAAYPRTRDLLERSGIDVRTVAVSETAKAEGGVTCCSILFESNR